ncbi:hypothetical protein ACHAXT_009503 [Thalassiosira profunda]
MPPVKGALGVDDIYAENSPRRRDEGPNANKGEESTSSLGGDAVGGGESRKGRLERDGNIIVPAPDRANGTLQKWGGSKQGSSTRQRRILGGARAPAFQYSDSLDEAIAQQRANRPSERRRSRGGSFTQKMGAAMGQLQKWGGGSMASKREARAEAVIGRQASNESEGKQPSSGEKRKSIRREGGPAKRPQRSPQGSAGNGGDSADAALAGCQGFVDEDDFGKGSTRARGANQPILKKHAGWISRSGPGNPPIAPSKNRRRKRSDRSIATLEKFRSQGGLISNADDNEWISTLRSDQRNKRQAEPSRAGKSDNEVITIDSNSEDEADFDPPIEVLGRKSSVMIDQSSNADVKIVPTDFTIDQLTGKKRVRLGHPAPLDNARNECGNPNEQEPVDSCPFADAVEMVEAKAKDGCYEIEVLVDELTNSEKGLDVPQHLAELAAKEPGNETVSSCLDWLWRNHAEELCYGKVKPITSCPHSGQMNMGVLNNEGLFDKAIVDGGLSFECPHDKEEESARDGHARSRGQKYLCLECGLVLCSRCEGGDSKGAHQKETGHCLFVGLFDLFVECRECDALFKLPLLEALPKKNAAFAGWCEDVIVDYERTEDSEWQVSAIEKPAGRLALRKRWNWIRMGKALAESSAMSSIDLSSCGARQSSAALPLLFDRQWKSFPTYLNLSDNPLGPKRMKMLEPVLAAASYLETLNLDNTELGRNGVRLLASALEHVRIGDLYLDNNQIGNRGVESILLASNARHLLHLWLSSNGIGSRGYKAICQFLQSETALQSLCLTDNDVMERGVLKILAGSIARNSALKEIDIEIEEDFEGAIPNFEWALCNTSCCFRALCNSNHTLWSIGDDTTDCLTECSDILLRAFEINARDATIGAKIRSKLRHFYIEGNFDVSPFLELDARLMPGALELATMSEEECAEVEGRLDGETPVLAQNAHLSGIYRMIRSYWNLHELFSFVSPEKELEEVNARLRSVEEENAWMKLEIERLSAATGL